MKMIECTYCGISANALDHIIQVSYDRTTRKNVKYSKENTVPVDKKDRHLPCIIILL